MNAKPARPLSMYRTVLIGGFLAIASPAWPAALTWVGTGADSDFNTPLNWSPAQTPGSSDTCTITSTSSRQPSVLTNASCGSLTLGTGAAVMTLTLTTKDLTVAGEVTIGANGRVTPSGISTGVWSIGGNWSDDFSATNFTSANIHHQFSFSGASKTITTNESFYHIQIGGTIALGSDLTIADTLDVINTSTLTHGPHTITMNGASLNVNGTYNFTCASTLVINGNPVNMTGGTRYPNVIINSGGWLDGATGSFIDCDLTNNSGGTFRILADVYVAGHWINNGGNYNDQHGHLEGDEVLKTMGRILTERARRSDTAARYGGEEFCVILPETARSFALKVAEDFRQMVAEFPFANRESQPLGKVTISVGLAEFPADANVVRGLIDRADQALYRAKELGRNQVCWCGEAPPASAAA